jgi:hypothetical protein
MEVSKVKDFKVFPAPTQRRERDMLQQFQQHCFPPSPSTI